MKYTAQEQSDAFRMLRSWIRPGDTVYTVLRHVSRSGMMRHISVYVIVEGENGQKARPVCIDWHVARILELPQATDGGVKIEGAGMDMGYHLVYGLSRRMFNTITGEEFRCIGDRCPSNDHFNGDAQGYTVGHKHTDGGYALRHSWI